MDDLSSIWSTCQESTDDLKQKILTTTLELESLKSLATESQDNVKSLLSLLEVACRERDEAKIELQKLLNNMRLIPSNLVEQFPHLVLQPEIPIFTPPKANSGALSEPNTLFETCISNQSHITTDLVDSLFDANHAISSPDFSDSTLEDSSHISHLNQPLTEELIGTTSISLPTNVVSPFVLDAKTDCVVKGRSLPQQGKLVQAVMEAGPLLQTLLVTGPYQPQWLKPPTFQLKGFESSRQKPVAITSPSSYLNVTSFQGFSQTCESANAPYAVSCKSLRLLNPRSRFDTQIPTAKRCRLQWI